MQQPLKHCLRRMGKGWCGCSKQHLSDVSDSLFTIAHALTRSLDLQRQLAWLRAQMNAEIERLLRRLARREGARASAVSSRMQPPPPRTHRAVVLGRQLQPADVASPRPATEQPLAELINN